MDCSRISINNSGFSILVNDRIEILEVVVIQKVYQKSGKTRSLNSGENIRKVNHENAESRLE
jgi:hypothetical protein